jgi:hypothetical protein
MTKAKGSPVVLAPSHVQELRLALPILLGSFKSTRRLLSAQRLSRRDLDLATSKAEELKLALKDVSPDDSFDLENRLREVAVVSLAHLRGRIVKQKETEEGLQLDTSGIDERLNALRLLGEHLGDQLTLPGTDDDGADVGSDEDE